MAGNGASIILQGQRPDVQVMSPYEISKQNLTLRQQQQSVAENDLTLEKIKAQIAQSKQDAQEDFAAQQIVNDPNLDTPTKLQKLGGVSNRIASTVGARLLKESQAGQAEDIQRAQLAQGQMAPEVKTPGPVIQGAQLPGYDPEQNGNGAVASAAPIQEAPTTQAVAIPPQDMEIRGALGKSFKVPVRSQQQQIAEAARLSSLEQAKLDMNARRTAAAEAAKIEETRKANQTTITYKGDSYTGPKDLADNWYNGKVADDRAKEERDARENEANRAREFQHGEGELTRKNAREIADERISAAAAKAALGKPPTAAESKSLGFHDRVANAKSYIDEMEPEIAKLGTLGQFQLNNAPNVLQTSLGSRFNQAANDFINASLRRESGAAISDAEYKRFSQIYFPQAGDDAKQLAQKKRARDVQMETFKTEAGRAYAQKYGDEDKSVAPSDTRAFKVIR